jgi:hypothetical protein
MAVGLAVCVAVERCDVDRRTDQVGPSRGNDRVA